LGARSIGSVDGAGGRRLPFPTKDDVALVDGIPLSVARFLELRMTLGKAGTQENTFRVGVAWLAIQNESQRRKLSFDPESALALARYSQGHLTAEEAAAALDAFFQSPGQKPSPSEFRKQVNDWIARSVVQRNPQVLAGLPKGPNE
jgi:hypothetical protein